MLQHLYFIFTFISLGATVYFIDTTNDWLFYGLLANLLALLALGAFKLWTAWEKYYEEGEV
ncbi:hypothetical protein [Bacillus toyonensis]|uniref:hypothetical protein n=1 Tax=Bacillus toyonensis TaxID=155322 RepID=UPI00027BEA5A|nr:hypothetical protein [Bacillus toyonensis]EJV41758.1 hypothetical protein IEA_05643 [Bacillus toyonensis]